MPLADEAIEKQHAADQGTQPQSTTNNDNWPPTPPTHCVAPAKLSPPGLPQEGCPAKIPQPAPTGKGPTASVPLS